MTTHHDNAIYTGLRRSARAAIALLAFGGLAFTPVHAKTEGETALANSPLPHERLGTGRDLATVPR